MVIFSTMFIFISASLGSSSASVSATPSLQSTTTSQTSEDPIPTRYSLCFTVKRRGYIEGGESLFLLHHNQSTQHSYFLYTSSYIAKTVIRLQIEGEGRERVVTPPLEGLGPDEADQMCLQIMPVDDIYTFF